MHPSDFTHHLQNLGRSEIAAVAADLRLGHETAEGEVAWWRATVAVDSALRQRRATRAASLVAHEAAAAVIKAADEAALDERARGDAVAVARAAADAARALVSAEGTTGVRLVCEPLLHPWYNVITATRAAVAPVTSDAA